MKTCLLLIVLLGLCGMGYVYTQHPEWLPKQWQLVTTQQNSPAPIPTPVADVPSPTPAAVKQWIQPPSNTIYPPDWTLADGTQYHKVKVLSVDADAVNIEHADGVCLINTANLPYDIQKLVNYDPDLAREAAVKRKAAEDQSDQSFFAPRPRPSAFSAAAVVPRPPAGPSRAQQIADLKAQIKQIYQQEQDALQKYRIQIGNGDPLHPNVSFDQSIVTDSYEKQINALWRQIGNLGG